MALTKNYDYVHDENFIQKFEEAKPIELENVLCFLDKHEQRILTAFYHIGQALSLSELQLAIRDIEYPLREGKFIRIKTTYKKGKEQSHIIFSLPSYDILRPRVRNLVNMNVLLERALEGRIKKKYFLNPRLRELMNKKREELEKLEQENKRGKDVYKVIPLAIWRIFFPLKT